MDKRDIIDSLTQFRKLEKEPLGILRHQLSTNIAQLVGTISLIKLEKDEEQASVDPEKDEEELKKLTNEFINIPTYSDTQIGDYAQRYLNVYENVISQKDAYLKLISPDKQHLIDMLCTSYDVLEASNTSVFLNRPSFHLDHDIMRIYRLRSHLGFKEPKDTHKVKMQLDAGRMIEILHDNSLRAKKRHGAIGDLVATVNTAIQDGMLGISYEDNAGGIPGLQHGQWYTGAIPTTKKQDGGAGTRYLSMQAREHGGEMQYTNTDSGAKFTILLPVDGPDSKGKYIQRAP